LSLFDLVSLHTWRCDFKEYGTYFFSLGVVRCGAVRFVGVDVGNDFTFEFVVSIVLQIDV